MPEADSSKRFNSIHDDYAFFEEHASEAEEDVRCYLTHLRSLVESGGLIRLLDFGCGGGEFSARLLSRAGFHPDKLTLTLVEPDEVYRRQAVTRTQAFTTTSVSAWPSLPPQLPYAFDLILANHVLYYVIDLDETLSRILNALAGGGHFLIAMAGDGNVLMQFCERGFASINQPMPYYRAEDVETSLTRLGLAFQKHRIPYELVFPDLKENRLKVLRFLLGDHFSQMAPRMLLSLFDPYSLNGRIVIQTFHHQYLIRK